MDSFITKFITSTQTPLVIEPKDTKISLLNLLTLLEKHNDFFQKNLLKHGGILLRNFPIQSVQDFNTVIKKLHLGKFVDYIGGDSPRKKIIEGIYTSTEAPPSVKIPLHNELSFVKHYPKHIYFYCDTPSTKGGQTIICDARKICQDINQEVKTRFMNKGLRYISRYPYKSRFMNMINKSHKSWIDVFETENKNEVEQKCIDNEFSFQWTQSDWIEITQTRPAVISHPKTEEKVWFNQAHLFDFNPQLLKWWQYVGVKLLYCRKHTLLHQISFADNTRVSRQDLYHILDVLDKNTVYFNWKKQDVLILDNILTMHGRESFKGKRKVFTAMTD